MKLLSTAGLLLCPALLLAQVLAPSERLNDRKHQINVFASDVWPKRTAASERIHALDGSPNWSDHEITIGSYPLLANQYRERNIGIGYTYHSGQHGFRFAISQKDGSDQGQNTDLLEVMHDFEIL